MPLTDEAGAKFRQDIVNEFSEHRNQIPLDISLHLLQMRARSRQDPQIDDSASVQSSVDTLLSGES